MLNNSDRIRGGFWGLLVGDALGVPYEFRPSHKIPAHDDIEMEPPVGYNREYPHIKPGTWSDDGAQALCLLDSLLEKEALHIRDFADRLVSWKENGLWAVDRLVFDVGNQTRDAIKELKAGVSPTRSGFVNPNGKGNGALMRVLPLALWHQGNDAQLIEDAHTQAIVTHGHITNQVCCALYCVWARRLMQGHDIDASYELAIATLRVHYGETSEYWRDLETVVRASETPITDGSGYVVSTLNAARLALRESTYEGVVRKAISFGIDTDTNAAVAGGLAGIRDGIQAIPSRWLEMMRGKELAQPLLERLVTLVTK
ncbi:ADP-ribosylglycohydrolase family protein [Alicyclobacillus sp. ALC3]|uniref:ADP-ribosylglycohydrolase family protein n=1 Tax=Alicyclobacillus sp. ALC3 TaxID=2796143 RepID=UPI0023792C8F|nr:ADP-ribosylglycohydrolase family protein [Alicyclobacillus sp. ALC3]WDL98454.1 ADP-ribosylglycohydrolase family protein [Alicyclobacillus sp. ALC3]